MPLGSNFPGGLQRTNVNDESGVWQRVQAYYIRTRQQITTTSNLTEAAEEVPGGVVDGVNRVFTLANKPATGTNGNLLILGFKNGQKLDYGTAYTIAGSTITYAVGYQPQAASGGNPADSHNFTYWFSS